MAEWRDLGPDWARRVDRLRLGLHQLSGTYAGRIEAEMKRRGPWQDRTSNARNRLFARAYRQGDEFGIVAGHGMQYGIYLELGTRYMRIPPTTSIGRPMHVQSTGLIGYPIVAPTLYQFREEYVGEARALVGRVFRGQA